MLELPPLSVCPPVSTGCSVPQCRVLTINANSLPVLYLRLVASWSAMLELPLSLCVFPMF